MTVARFWRRKYAAVILQGGLLLFVHLAPLLMAALALGMGRSTTAVVVALALPLYWAGGALAIVLMELAVRRVVRSRGEDADWLTASAMRNWLPGFVWAHVAFLQTLWRSLHGRSVQWRGIEYRLEPDGRVRLVDYRPFAHKPKFLKRTVNQSVV